MSNQDYKTPMVLRYLWERRNKLVQESKKLEWTLEKHGESEFANDYTLQGMLEEIRQFDVAIDFLQKADKFSIAKYHAIGVLGIIQDVFNKKITEDVLKSTYEGALLDIDSGAIEKSVIEYDKLMNK